ncbi:LysR family transcriptional regulator [Roseibium sp. CAU 1637]|uniref:LysR family transcriptional regulator n=1 Tax=Roseibium limicola TaxID=2816037 RepID=A0A939JB39_9HYPH|nr:LysR family transcriptional regulator [Roseibium limicola]MBO0347048.1 LysR family transcriptional regulator [Roseibium limicola]
MRVFSEVAKAGSFSAAARELNMTPSAVSKIVTKIEDELRVPMFDRSTKRLALTYEGEIFLETADRVAAEIEVAKQKILESRYQPMGLLRISCSVPIGVRRVLPLVPEFDRCYPQVDIDVNLEDGLTDIIDKRVDVAVRLGTLKDSSLKARKIAESRRVIVASPAYLAVHGVPQTPADLTNHECLQFNLGEHLNEWPMLVDGKLTNTVAGGRYRANNGETIRNLALLGVGLARLAWFQVGEAVAAGQLVPVLEKYHPGDTQGVYALFFNHRYISTRVRAFVDFLVEHLGQEKPFLGANYYSVAFPDGSPPEIQDLGGDPETAAPFKKPASR